MLKANTYVNILYPLWSAMSVVIFCVYPSGAYKEPGRAYPDGNILPDMKYTIVLGWPPVIAPCDQKYATTTDDQHIQSR